MKWQLHLVLLTQVMEKMLICHTKKYIACVLYNTCVCEMKQKSYYAGEIVNETALLYPHINYYILKTFVRFSLYLEIS